MNRLQNLFNTKKQNLLSIYFTAGYPDLSNTVELIQILEQAGVDFIELGFPYSDPVADGPIIQNSSQKALEHGMNLHLLFEQLKDLRKHVTIPILLMGYVNPIVQFGVENFCKTAAEVGVDGIIVPDLPMYEYENLYAEHFKEHNLSNIFMVTPQTSEERIRKIDSLSNSFIYLLSSSSITGVSLNVSTGIEDYYKRVKAMNLKNPTIIGFGITNNATFTKACEYAAGAIIGSAFVKFQGENDYISRIASFINTIRG
jgi:tryptophan synthase alpha chain